VHHRCMLFAHTLSPIQARCIRTCKNRTIFLYTKTYSFINLLRSLSKRATLLRSEISSGIWKKKRWIRYIETECLHRSDEGNFIPIGVRLNGFKPVRRNFSSSTRKISAFSSRELALFAAFIGRHFQVESIVNVQSIFEHTSQLNDAW